MLATHAPSSAPASTAAKNHSGCGCVPSIGLSTISAPSSAPPSAPEAEADAGAVHEIGLDEIAGLVQLGKIGAAPGEKVHVAVFHASEQQVVGRVARAFDIGKEKVKASAHELPPKSAGAPHRVRLRR
jgi:hypothetical protein